MPTWLICGAKLLADERDEAVDMRYDDGAVKILEAREKWGSDDATDTRGEICV